MPWLAHFQHPEDSKSAISFIKGAIRLLNEINRRSELLAASEVAQRRGELLHSYAKYMSQRRALTFDAANETVRYGATPSRNQTGRDWMSRE